MRIIYVIKGFRSSNGQELFSQNDRNLDDFRSFLVFEIPGGGVLQGLFQVCPGHSAEQFETVRSLRVQNRDFVRAPPVGP